MAQRRVRGPIAGLNALAVHPLGSIGVPLHLHVLPQLLIADGPTFLKQLLDLLEHQGVALDRGRVVSFFQPNPSPDVPRLDRGGEATETPP